MATTDLKQRTKRFALDVISFFEALPEDETSRILGRQLLRSGTSVGANYRAAKRAKSNADFISKMGTVEEEADECAYWIELLTESGKTVAAKSTALLRESEELLAIAIASINTARARLETRSAERGTRKESGLEMRNVERRAQAAESDKPAP
jgi:four helix bundle protein